MDIAEKIKEARKNAGLTQKELSNQSGVAVVSIQQYERGVRQPRIERLQRIAKALDVPINQLIDFDTASEYTKIVAGLTDDLHPSEFNEFERFIETMGYYVRLDGENYQLRKGKKAVAITPEELKALVRASKATVGALVRDLMERATPPPDGSEGPQEGG